MAVLTESQVRQLASQAGWSGADLDIAVAVAQAESSFDTNSINNVPAGKGCGPSASRDRGLFQINSACWSGCTDACAFDPQCNASYAHDVVWKQQGWSGWTTFNTGAYRPYLTSSAGGTPTGTSNDLAAFYSPARITQPYGATSYTAEPAGHGYAHWHAGIDYGETSGTPIPSLTQGVVEKVVAGCTVGDLSCGSGFGNHPEVRMPDGRLILYGHMTSVAVRVGDAVLPGTVLGAVGTTGNSSGPHTHVQLYGTDGSDEDPTALITMAISQGASYQGTAGSGDTSGGSGAALLSGQTYDSLAYGLHSAVNHSDSFADLCKAVHSLEMMRPMTWSNPAGSLLANAGAVTFRGLVVLSGVVMLVIAVVGFGLSTQSVLNAAQNIGQKDGEGAPAERTPGFGMTPASTPSSALGAGRFRLGSGMDYMPAMGAAEALPALGAGVAI